MSARTYTREQILYGLHLICTEDMRCHGFFHADTRLDEYFMSEGAWDELDTGALAEDLHAFFGCSCPLEEWEQFFGWTVMARDKGEWERRFASSFTFGGLADFIRARAEPIPLEPLSLLGKPCRAAGIFRGLERLAQQIHPEATRFAPSTPIRTYMRGLRLSRFWLHLRWITEERIPPPRRIELGCGGFYFKVGIGLLIALWNRDLEGLWLGLKVTALLFLPTVLFMEFLNWWITPLPKEIITFGDLARYLAIVTLDREPECA